MTQYARPDSDVSVGSWATAPLWSKLDEETADDATTSITTTTPGTVCEVSLSDVADPLSNTGHVIRIRHRNSSDKNISADLYQGATLKASLSLSQVGAVWTTESYTLSGVEADSIAASAGNYTDLRLRFTAGNIGVGTAEITQAQFEVPDVATGFTGWGVPL